MARTKRWAYEEPQHGMQTATLSGWRYFAEFIHQEFLDYRSYIFRGQSASKWRLEPTLDRLLRGINKLHEPEVRREHLAAFQYATRGRRGSNPPRMANDNEWWALGQHYGLATPLLDWTVSPFVAAYFAFAPEANEEDEYRAVWALFRSDNPEDRQGDSAGSDRPAVVEFIRPMSDDNFRLVSQGGLFTRGPDGVDLEEWHRREFTKETKMLNLMKIRIPSKDRALCLRWLNRMNINHLSLFPDVYGASKYCNFDLTIENY